ncbi:MAG: polyprenyl synthetase family protein [Angelakisella sp.]
MDWNERYPEYCKRIEAALPQYLPETDTPQGKVSEAMAYSLLGGGKRIRGCLVLAMCELCGGDPESALPIACAVEMVHAYSLIHDDLPCMDNDTLRRGKPTCHIQFDEATALLAGDALLAHAFTAVNSAYFNGTLPADTVLRCISQLARAAGVEGMIGGQIIDIAHDSQPMTPELLEEMHAMKTGALIRASAVMGCLAAGAPRDIVLQADLYAARIGLAFQIVDDILDATGDSSTLGKSTSDAQNHKTTYVTLYGEENAREMVRRLVLEADLAVKGTVLDDKLLYDLADTLAKRKH